MMSNYALIKDGFVQNVVVWDGTGDIFDDYITVEVKDYEPVQIGDAYVEGVLYIKPRDGYDYNFDASKLVWTIAEASSAQKSADNAACNLSNARSEYERASDQITAINQRIDDEDYSDELTPDIVSALKESWTNYRKELRAYIQKNDGAVKLPSPPVNT